MTEHESQELNLEALKADIDKLRSELTDLVQKFTDMDKGKVGIAKEELGDKVQCSMDKIRQLLDDGSKVGKKGIGAIQRQIGERSLISLLIVVLGLGLLIAKLLRGKSEN